MYTNNMNYIKREMENELQTSASEYPIVAILGPRQSGKTTLAKLAFTNKKYISLEDLENREFATSDPKGFLQTHKEGAIIDEIQRVPSLLSYLQSEVDQNRRPGRFILTGSNQYLLQEKLVQSLAGRISLLRLLPLSILELQKQKLELNLEQLMLKGFYPELHTKEIRATNWLNNYIETYVDKDVRLIKNIENLVTFHSFLKMCASRAGSLINYTSLSNDCGISQRVVKSWLSILESSFIIKLVHPFHKNFNKRLVKSPKIYFRDTGMLCRLLGINSTEEVASHFLRGGIFENMIMNEIEKYYYNNGKKPEIFFWRDKNGHEIDFVIEGKKSKWIEVKSGKTISEDFFKNIKYLKNVSKKELESYLIYGGNEKQMRSGTKVLSWKHVGELFYDM